MKNKFKETDEKYLRRCLELAAESVEAGDQAFGSILVDEDGKIIAEGRNRTNEKNILAHPEIELAHWAADYLSEQERANTTMYTTGEHCPMCSAAHGLVGLGTLVYLSSAKQLVAWRRELNLPEANINYIPVEEIIKKLDVRGPAEGDLLEEIKNLHRKRWSK